MFGSSILEVAIGLIFVYLLLSLICSAVNEIIESFLKNRATDLERGIRELFNQKGGSGLVADFYEHPLINGLFRGLYERQESQKIGLADYLHPTNLPSYIPARNFSYAVLDLVLHPPSGAAIDRDDAVPAQSDAAREMPASAAAASASGLPVSMDAVRAGITRNLGNTQVGRALRTLAEQSGEDINAMRTNVESWFNGSMDRVSGMYKRRTKWIIFVIGFALTVFLNVNTITIARRLSTDATLRNLIVAQAAAFADKTDAQTANFDINKKALEGLGLPLGWPSTVNFFPSPLNPWDHIFIPLMGWLLTVAAISLGAPFWFDLLNKFMVIRATVKPHEKSLEEGSEDRQQETTFSLAAPAIAGAQALAPASPMTGPVYAPTQETGFTATPEPELAVAPDPPDNESHLEGCNIPIVNVTTDEELPPTKGGVA